MGKARRFSANDNSVAESRRLTEAYGQLRQSYSGISSSFASAPKGKVSNNIRPDLFKSSGGQFTGAIGFASDVHAIDATNKLDIGKNSGGDIKQIRTLVYVSSVTSSTLDEIIGKIYDGQIVILSGISGQSAITITHASGNPGQILCPNDTNYTLSDDESIILIHDVTAAFTTWRLLSTSKGVGDDLGNHTATQNLNLNANDIEKVNLLTFNDDPNNNFIASITTGVTYNVNSTDHHKFFSGLTELMRLDTSDISLGVNLDMNSNNIDLCNILNFATSGQNLTSTADAILYQVSAGDTHDFIVSAVSRFEVEQSKISLKEDTEVTGGKKVKASNSTKIGFQVTNFPLTVGSQGSVQVPYIANSNSSPVDSTVDGWFGNQNGCIGIQYEPNGGTHRLWFKSNGSWVKAFGT